MTAEMQAVARAIEARLARHRDALAFLASPHPRPLAGRAGCLAAIGTLEGLQRDLGLVRLWPGPGPEGGAS